MSTASDAAVHLVAELGERKLTVAVAESVTGGLLMGALTAVPGASEVLRGGVVVYATDTKASQLGVDPDLLEANGPVDAEVATAMALAVRGRWASDIGVATTGVAGPDPQAGHEVGEVYVAVVDGAGDHVERLNLQPSTGSADSEQVRSQIRQDTVDAALGQIRARLGSL